MNFSDALHHLLKFEKLQREGWNGKGMWIALVNGRDWDVKDRIKVEHNRSQSEQVLLKHLPWIMMRTADNGIVPWLASQTDILAVDWQLAPESPKRVSYGDENGN